MSKYKVGETVKWKTAGKPTSGKVKEVYEKAVSRKIKDTEVKKNGSKDNPVYLIEQEDKDIMLHLESELV